MEVFESSGIMAYMDEDGDLHIHYPVTKAENVEGLEDVVIINKIIGSGSPTTSVKGKMGQTYYDKLNGTTYTCTAITTDEETGITKYIWEVSGTSDASKIRYNNDNSGLTSENVQAAIDELAASVDGIKVLTGTTDPTAATVGKVGQHYINTTTPKEFTCLAADTEHGKYTWEAGGGGGGSSIALNRIYVDTQPTKHSGYKAGETFDPTGMVVKADYAINDIVIIEGKTVTGYTYPTAGLAASTSDVTVTISLTENGVTKTATVNIGPVTKTDVDVPTSTGNKPYNGNTQTFTFNNEPSSAIATKSGDTSGMNVGPYTTRWTLNDTALYQWADGSTAAYKEVTTQITKVTPTVTAPTKAEDMTFDGTDRDLTATAGSTDYGTLQYSADGGTTWSATRPTATDVGSYALYYRVVGDSNINSVESTSLGTVTIAQRATTLTASPSSVTLNTSNLTATSVVTCDGDGTLSVETSDNSIATAVIDVNTKIVTISHVNQTTGTATITVKHRDGTNYADEDVAINVNAAFISGTLNDNSWAAIKEVSDADKGDDYWDTGDVKEVTINGTVGSFTFSNLKVNAFIIGFNHNSAKEGTHRIHFMFGKISGTAVAFCDSKYNSQGAAGNFVMNTTNTNSGGWNGSYMRKTLLGNDGTPSNPPANSFMAALPSDLRAVMKSVTKYTDNTGNSSNTEGAVTATTDYLFLLAEFEAFGARSGANQYEQNKQLQYAYFSANNTNAQRIAYNHTAASAAVWWWLRSAYYTNNSAFRSVYTDGNVGNNLAYYSGGLRPGFAA